MNHREPVREPQEPGVHLTVTTGAGGEFAIEHMARIRSASRSSVNRPTLGGSQPPPPTRCSEFIVHVLSGEALLDSFAWPVLIADHFDDFSPASQHGSNSGWARASHGTRYWRFPLRERASFLYIVRADWDPARSDRGLTSTSLALLRIAPGDRKPAIELAELEVVQPIDVDLRSDSSIPAEPRPSWLAELSVPPEGLDPWKLSPWESFRGGKVIGAHKVFGTREVDRAFNIVAVGDGFDASDQETYDARVDALVKMLRTTSPFSGVKDRINLWSIRTISTDSGISQRGVSEKNTYYKATGRFGDSPVPGYIGTDDQQRLDNATRRAVPDAYRHLVVLIANCPALGGRGVAALSTVFMPLCTGYQLDQWMDMVAHEIGHAAANLAEERIVGTICECGHYSCHPNQTTTWELLHRTTRWYADADQDEDGCLKAIHICGDPMTWQPGLGIHQPAMEPGLYGLLGAFWGCENIQPPPEDLGCDPSQDPRGWNYYRPMAECRMRLWGVGWEFCRVCQKTLTELIVTYSGG